MNEQVEQVNQFYNVIVEFFANYSLQIVGAVIILIIGVIASKYVQKFVLKIMLKNNIDETLSLFASNFVRFLIIAMMGIVALGKLGISIAPFIAALGALSLTAGLALQGTVANFASGVVLVITKPFKLGDTITVHDVYGQVEEIKLSYTVLVNEDKEQITIPNKYMIGDVLVNSFSYRIVEGSIGISYEDDASNAIKIIKELIAKHQDVNSENEAIVGIEKFGESSVDIGYRYWARTDKFFKVQYEINLEIYKQFKNEGVSIPFPQREVRFIKDDEL